MNYTLNFYETMQVLGLDEHTLSRLVIHGQIPHYRKGAILRFDREQCLAWMEEERKLNNQCKLPENAFELVKKLQQIETFWTENRKESEAGPVRLLAEQLERAIKGFQESLARTWPFDPRKVSIDPLFRNEVQRLCRLAENVQVPREMRLQGLRKNLKDIVRACLNDGQRPEQNESYQTVVKTIQELTAEKTM